MPASKKYYHKKLVRDKIPQIIEGNGEEYKSRTMREGEYKKLLRKKLVEEAKEAATADKEDVASELGDVLEVVRAIAKSQGSTMAQVEKKRQDKEKRLGGFRKKIFLIWSSRPKGTGAK